MAHVRQLLAGLRNLAPVGLDEFWQQRLPDGREAVSWEKVLELLVVNHLLDPASEFRVHRQWFLSTAMDELLNVDYAVAEKDRLYRCLDRVLEHKQDLFVWLRGKWADLFHADFEVLLYDLTSTYFEGAMEESPKARRGYSRDGRPDCLQVVVALASVPRQNREDLRKGEAVASNSAASCARPKWDGSAVRPRSWPLFPHRLPAGCDGAPGCGRPTRLVRSDGSAPATPR